LQQIAAWESVGFNTQLLQLQSLASVVPATIQPSFARQIESIGFMNSVPALTSQIGMLQNVWGAVADAAARESLGAQIMALQGFRTGMGAQVQQLQGMVQEVADASVRDAMNAQILALQGGSVPAMAGLWAPSAAGAWTPAAGMWRTSSFSPIAATAGTGAFVDVLAASSVIDQLKSTLAAVTDMSRIESINQQIAAWETVGFNTQLMQLQTAASLATAAAQAQIAQQIASIQAMNSVRALSYHIDMLERVMAGTVDAAMRDAVLAQSYALQGFRAGLDAQVQQLQGMMQSVSDMSLRQLMSAQVSMLYGGGLFETTGLSAGPSFYGYGGSAYSNPFKRDAAYGGHGGHGHGGYGGHGHGGYGGHGHGGYGGHGGHGGYGTHH
jgi:hypothetical protein